ncbi:transcriptional regulator BetI [Gemmobacter straminiformis]|uniref:HTH-type transcriptional regulator BetI n=1 Tax=Paragemmobacter straminiformis TaxID=2045119 RepID=A0A842I629_9RHOB|nr:transcriptional regulator BetI [Gemmobacter straminiformis]
MPLALRSISDIRRQELRAAAFRVLQREGVQGTTLEKVAAEAGASKGIVLHYFRSKAELFEQVMREANLVLRDRVNARLARADSPQARLIAIVEGNFEPDMFIAPVCHAWLSLCAQVPRDAALARIQRVIHARMQSNLMSGLRPLLPVAEAEAKALQISALIDGLWLRLGLAPGSMTPDEAIAIVRQTLGPSLLPPPH